MFSIGEFSKITRLPIKTLRYYHERRLLVPANVDVGSGYRYYNGANIERARIIVTLRGLEFSLEEIGNILADCEDGRAGSRLPHCQAFGRPTRDWPETGNRIEAGSDDSKRTTSEGNHVQFKCKRY